MLPRPAQGSQDLYGIAFMLLSSAPSTAATFCIIRMPDSQDMLKSRDTVHAHFEAHSTDSRAE